MPFGHILTPLVAVLQRGSRHRRRLLLLGHRGRTGGAVRRAGAGETSRALSQRAGLRGLRGQVSLVLPFPCASAAVFLR